MMTRRIARWTLAVTAAALLALPAAGAAQTPPPSQPPATAQPPATQPPTPAANPQKEATSAGGANDHLQQASAALNDVKTASLSTRAKAQVAEIKKRINTLERAKPGGKTNWGNEVAAIDKALTALLGPDATTGASPTGTTGTTPPAKTKAADLDEASRAKLLEVRTHLTAYATAMAGGPPDKPAAKDPAAEPPAAPPTSTEPPATATPPASTQPATQPPTTDPAPGQPPVTAQPSGSGQVDEAAARQHLTEARNTLSDLTQLPAAAQLSGEARTQVSQLISSFNELITTKAEWRESYAKVNANLTALIGPYAVSQDEPLPPTGTPGAVGTSGAGMNLDPAIRAKLVELRTHLMKFEKVSGGAAAAPSASPATEPPGTKPPATTPPMTTPPDTPPATTPPATAPPATAPPTGTTPPSGTDPQGTASADITRHLNAIEALLKMQDESGGLTLTKAQVEELRSHWTALRQALVKK